MNNEIKKLTRNRTRRIERRIKLDDKMKSLLNKIKTEQKKSFDGIENLEIELVKNKFGIDPNLLQSKLKELNKIEVIDKKLHEIKNETFLAYTGDCGLVCSLKIGDQIRQTQIRFRNITDYEQYINAIDRDYESEDAVFNG